MTELIAIREAARRLGVSDTAVRKAIAAGRVKVAGNHESNGRPLLAWPDCETEWMRNSDQTKRSHVGSRGSPMRDSDPPPRTKLATSNGDGGDEARGDDLPLELDDEGNPIIRPGISLADAQRVKAIWSARQAQLNFQRDADQLVPKEAVQQRAFKAARNARDALQTMEDRLAPILASLTDLQEVRIVLREDIRRVCERIAADTAAL
jgi:hypothetical protein